MCSCGMPDRPMSRHGAHAVPTPRLGRRAGRRPRRQPRRTNHTVEERRELGRTRAEPEHRPGQDREGGARDPRGDRRGSRPRRPRAHAAARIADDVRRDLQRLARPTRRVTSRSRSRPTTTRWSWCATSRSSGCASTTCSVPRSGTRRLHPGRRRSHHRPVEDRATRRRLRAASAGAGAADHADRRRADGPARSRRACS